MRNTSKVKRDYHGRFVKGTAKPKGSGMKKGTSLADKIASSPQKKALDIAFNMILDQQQLSSFHKAFPVWTDKDFENPLRRNDEIIIQTQKVTIGKLEQEIDKLRQSRNLAYFLIPFASFIGTIIGLTF